MITRQEKHRDLDEHFFKKVFWTDQEEGTCSGVNRIKM